MSKDPAVLFYTSDFLAGTSFFTDEEVGKYIRLLCQQHQIGHIPNGHMTRLCPHHDHPILSKFKQDENGNWYNERMEDEKERRANYCKSRNNNKNGYNQHSNKIGHMTTHMTGHMTGHMETDTVAVTECVTEVDSCIKTNIDNIRRSKNPSIEQIKDYCQERKNFVDPEQFFAFYESKGWKVGNQAMKNWKMAIVTWEKRNNNTNSKNSWGV